MGILDYICMAFFLVLIVFIGGIFARREQTTSAFLLGGSKMPWWAVGISLMMALLSTVSIVAIPGEAYNNGLRLYICDWLNPIFGLIMFYIFIKFYFKCKTFTPFAYLETRYSAGVRAIISSAYLFMRVSYLAMVLFSCAMVFKGLVNWNVPITIALIGFIALLYSALGGLKAVIWVNVIKFFILSGSLAAAVIVCVGKVDDGAVGVLKFAFSNEHGFNFNTSGNSFFSADPHVRITLWLLLISSFCANMFNSSADQIGIQQLLSTSSFKQARKSFLTAMCVSIPFSVILWFLGLSMFAYFSQNPMPGGNPPGDIALYNFIKLQMPSPMPGLIASAMLATAISTSGAAMNALATVATKDFYFRFFKPEAIELDQVAFSRKATVLVGMFAIFLSITISLVSRSLGETVIEAASMWMAVMCVIGPTFFIGVISPRTNTIHIVLAIIAGWITTLVMICWYYVSKRNGVPISFLFIQVPGFFATMIVGLVSPYLFGKSAPASKTNGLTLWSFNFKNKEQSAKADYAVKS